MAPAGDHLGQAPSAEDSKAAQLLNLAVSVVVVGALYFARDILIPITLAVLLAFVLAPLVQLLRRLKLPRAPAVLLAAALSLAVLLGLGAVIGAQVTALLKDAPQYQGVVEGKLKTLNGLTTGKLSTLATRLGPVLAKVTGPAPAARGTRVAPGSVKPVPVEIRQPAPSGVELLRRLVGPVLKPLVTTALVFVVAIFILLQRTDLRDRLIRLLGSRDLHRTSAAMNDAAQRLSRYFLTQLAVNAGFGAVIGTGLYFIGVPHTLLWAAVAALTRFIPYVGGIVSAALPAALAAAVDPGWTMVIWTLGLFIGLEAFTGQVVEPLLYGRSTGLSPLSVLVAAIFWSWLWGPIGLILSTPLSLCLLVLGRHVPQLAYIEVLLGDRPPLTPAESFYQRALAGDSDEALEQAEVLLKKGLLSAYYDEVAMKGLGFAAADLHRGVLRPEQLGHIGDTVSELVTILASHPDHETQEPAEESPVGPTPEDPPLGGSAPKKLPVAAEPTLVLCVPAHGVLDEAANLMLAQLLEKHGLQVRCLPRQATARPKLAGVDLSGAGLVCISYFPCGSTHTRLRYLVRTLRQCLPEAPLVIGAWQDGEHADATGIAPPNLEVTSLREAVDACVDLTMGAGAAVNERLRLERVAPAR